MLTIARAAGLSLIMLGIFGASACQHPSSTPQVTASQLPSTSETKADIVAVLDAQQAAWNRGDIDDFMQGYWNSDQLRFASGGSVTRGWDTVNQRYKRNYSDDAAMGTLRFEALEIELLSSGVEAVIYGGWRLERADDTPSGLFMLLLRQIDGRWKIISDTTTSAD